MPIINPTLPYILTNGTLADATQVMADFESIISQVNANAVEVGSILSGSLVNLQFLSSSTTYNPSANATKALVFGQGAGAAGGGTEATSSQNVAAGSGGTSGTQALLFIASGLTSQTVTCGAGGTGVSGAAGGNGGSSSFGGYLTLPGGIGGYVGVPGGGSLTANVSASPPALPAAPSGSGNIIFSTQGRTGLAGIALLNPLGGGGGNSWFGAGGVGGQSGAGSAATGFGAGGAGSAQTISEGASAGYAGTGAAFLVLEFA